MTATAPTGPTPADHPSSDRTPTEAFAERLVTQFIDGMEMLSIYIGQRLGLYQALDTAPGSTPDALAEAAGIHRRYAREWLEQQATAGVLTTAAADAAPYERRYRIPAAHRPVLLDVDSTLHVGPLARVLGGTSAVLTDLLDAYRTGGGVPYRSYGTDVRTAISTMNRPVFRTELASWIAAMPAVDTRLRESEQACVLDLACGTGWSSIALAQVYPRVRVQGIDLDEASVTEARANALREGFADRVSFEVGDVSTPVTTSAAGTYDLVCVFEGLHDMADPVAALSRAAALLRPGGSVLIADERVAEDFTAPGDEMERLNYSISVLHCLPATMAESPVVEAGTVLRPEILRGYAAAASLPEVDVLPVENFLWRLYRLRAAT